MAKIPGSRMDGHTSKPGGDTPPPAKMKTRGHVGRRIENGSAGLISSDVANQGLGSRITDFMNKGSKQPPIDAPVSRNSGTATLSKDAKEAFSSLEGRTSLTGRKSVFGSDGNIPVTVANGANTSSTGKSYQVQGENGQILGTLDLELGANGRLTGSYTSGGGSPVQVAVTNGVIRQLDNNVHSLQGQRRGTPPGVRPGNPEGNVGYRISGPTEGTGAGYADRTGTRN